MSAILFNSELVTPIAPAVSYFGAPEHIAAWFIATNTGAVGDNLTVSIPLNAVVPIAGIIAQLFPVINGVAIAAGATMSWLFSFTGTPGLQANGPFIPSDFYQISSTNGTIRCRLIALQDLTI